MKRRELVALVQSMGPSTVLSMGRNALADEAGVTRDQSRRMLDIAAGISATVDVSRQDRGGRVTLEGPCQSLDDLVERAGIDLDQYRIQRWRANTWTTATREGLLENWQVRADLEPRLAEVPVPPPWGALPRAQPDPDAGARGLTRVLVVPDLQVGYRWSHKRDVLEPMHDRRCMDLYLQLARRRKPDVVVLVGDNVDFAPMSTKFDRPDNLRGTSQPSVWALAYWLRELRQAAPAARIVYMEGNHERRLRDVQLGDASELQGLAAYGDRAPLVTVERMLGLDALDVEYHGPYGETMWLDDSLAVLHGVRVSARPGATSAAVLSDYRHSAVYGHIHRVEQVSATIPGPGGQIPIAAGSPGCGCRIDGAVPGHPGTPDWQQGWGFVEVERDTGAVWMDMHRIIDGRTTDGGVMLHGEDYAEREAEATGYAQVARGRCT